MTDGASGDPPPRGGAPRLALYSYWRASAPHRVRIGLGLKGLAYEYRAVNLAAGEQGGGSYSEINPQHLTPALVDGERVITQSLAILEWLEETRPSPPLLPAEPADRAVVRAMAGIVACDIHPLNNLRVLRALADVGPPMGSEAQGAWARRWIGEGFDALEAMIARHGGGFAFGDRAGLADCCLAPQIVSAERFGLPLHRWPRLMALARRYAEEPAFIAAHPVSQPDAPAR